MADSWRRFTLFLLLAMLIHSMLIWGFGFRFFEQINQYFPTLDITLTPLHDEQQVEDADFLSQFNSVGGGEQRSENKLAQQMAAAGGTQPKEQEKGIAQRESEQGSQRRVEAESAVGKTQQQTPSLSQLLNSSQQVIQLGMEEQKLGSSDQLRHRYVSANTKQYLYASYIEGWQYKVERVGNINFPLQAKKQNISGELVLDVGINQDGSIHSIKVRRSSGHQFLDEAAVKIVKMAAPFAPLPTDIKNEVDVLHIVRSWQFLSGNRQLKTTSR